MANTGNSSVDTSPEATLAAQKRLYKGVMDFTMLAGLPLGGAVAVLVAVLLLKAGIFASFFAAFVTMIGLWIFSKSFLVH